MNKFYTMRQPWASEWVPGADCCCLHVKSLPRTFWSPAGGVIWEGCRGRASLMKSYPWRWLWDFTAWSTSSSLSASLLWKHCDQLLPWCLPSMMDCIPSHCEWKWSLSPLSYSLADILPQIWKRATERFRSWTSLSPTALWVVLTFDPLLSHKHVLTFIFDCFSKVLETLITLEQKNYVLMLVCIM